MQTFGARWIAGPAALARAWEDDCGAVDRRLLVGLLALPALVAIRFWPVLLGLVPAVVAAALLSSPPRRPAKASVITSLSIAVLVCAAGYEAMHTLWGDDTQMAWFVQIYAFVLLLFGASPEHAGPLGGHKLRVALRVVLVVGLCVVGIAVLVAALRATSALELCWAASGAAAALWAVWLATRHRRELQRLSHPETWRQVGDDVVVPTQGGTAVGYRDPAAQGLEINATIDVLRAAVSDVRWRCAFMPVAVLALGGTPVIVDLVAPRFPSTIPSDAVISMGSPGSGDFYLEIDAKGHVTWQGREGVAVVGRRERDISPTEVAALYQHMMSGDFSEQSIGRRECNLGRQSGAVRLRTQWRSSRVYRAPSSCRAPSSSSSRGAPTFARQPSEDDACDVEGQIHRIAGAWLGGLGSLSVGDALTLSFDVDPEPRVCASEETVDGFRCERRDDALPRHVDGGALVPFRSDGPWGSKFIVADPWSERALGPLAALPEKGGNARCRFTAVRQLAGVGTRIGDEPRFYRTSRIWAGTLSDCTVRRQ